jgi:hypothetical protein
MSSLFCPDATCGLVDRERLQLYYADHSVILVSSAINFSGGDGLNKFIAFFIACYRLSFEKKESPGFLVSGGAEDSEDSGGSEGSENSEDLENSETLKDPQDEDEIMEDTE